MAGRFFPDPGTGVYRAHREPVHLLMKVETHNHPTAISPFPGAATGSGGEIRDEGATGRGGKPKAGLTGFTVCNLRLPGAVRPWEVDHGKPDRIVSALEIMIDGPLGGAAFNNEFGRPNLAGYFRTFELEVDGPGRAEVRGYHKPIMIAGGLRQHPRPGRARRRPSCPAPPSWCWAAPPCSSAWAAARPPPCRRAPRTRTSTSPRCSAATPRCSGAARR